MTAVHSSAQPNGRREAAHEHALGRATEMQRVQTSTLAARAHDVQSAEHTQRERRERVETLRASRTSEFDAAPRRNDRLELVENIACGPYAFEAPSDDAAFERFEPHAQTKLRRRYVPYAQVHTYMHARYALTPSTLYSLIREDRKNAAAPPIDGDYEVPVLGDWVLFAVMGEKSALKYTNASHTDDAHRTPRNYFACKLLDLGISHTDTYGQLPGHCVMNMLAFEAHEHNASKTYRGGSGGAFEKLWKERDGVLLAILNPRIMRARNGTTELTITPRSAESVLVLGVAEQYGRCEALRKDGTRCTSFVLQHAKSRGVCEMHLEMAVAGRQRTRMECATAMSSYAAQPPKHPLASFGQPPSKRVQTRTSYLPFDGLDAPQYIVPGSRLALPASDPSSMAFDITAQFGRGRQEKEQRNRRELEQASYMSQLHAHGEPRERRTKAAAPLEDALLADMDQNCVAAHALRTAQATLRGHTLKHHEPQVNTTAKQESGSVSRLLARHKAPAESLPKAKLHAAKFRSNVLDRDGPAARHVQSLNTGDDLVIIDRK